MIVARRRIVVAVVGTSASGGGLRRADGASLPPVGPASAARPPVPIICETTSLLSLV